MKRLYFEKNEQDFNGDIDDLIYGTAEQTHSER